MKICKVLIASLLSWTPLLLAATGEPHDVNNFLHNEIPRLSPGSCLAAGLCCKGKDSSCVVQRASANSIIEDIDDIPCYCDHGCVLLDDCCSDFKQACGVQNCVMSGWGMWSSCDTECGPGSMKRSRSVLRESKNGGKSCPSLTQKRGCRGTNCRHHTNKINVEDTAVLLPIEYSEKRKLLSGNSNLTKHLRLRYPKNPEKEKAKPYCVEFEVIRSSRACQVLESFTSFREGSRICVFCEREAQKPYANYRCAGSGTTNDTGFFSRFSSLIVPACGGKLRHIRSGTTCSCQEGPHFIFV